MATMAYRVASKYGKSLKKINESADFYDAANISEYAREAVYAMQAASILNGVGNNKFMPLDMASRAEAAKIIYFLIGE